MKKNKIAWHYTTGEKFMQIVKDGYLKPTGIGIKGKEKSILWFSTNPYFEKTSCKLAFNGVSVRTLTMEEIFIAGSALVRFGVLTNSLISWDRLSELAKMPRKISRALEGAGKEQGANPSQWYGLIGTQLDIYKCVSIQVMNVDMQWKEVTL
mgnify:CR=1 FL=1